MYCISVGAGNEARVPDFVFLAHMVDISSAMHVPFVLRSTSSLPYTTRLFFIPCLPFTFIVVMVMWLRSKTFLLSFYNLRGRLHQTWVVPRCGFQVGHLFYNFFFLNLTFCNCNTILQLQMNDKKY